MTNMLSKTTEPYETVESHYMSDVQIFQAKSQTAQHVLEVTLF